MKLHLPHLLCRYLLAGFSIAVPYAFLTLPTTHAAQSVSSDDCAYYQKYYLDNGKYYIAVISGGSVSGGGNVDYTVPSPAVGAYGFKNTSIGNGTGSALNVSIQGPGSYGISGGTLINGGSLNLSAEAASSSAYGTDSTTISNEASGSMTILSRSNGNNASGIRGGSLMNSGMVDITAETSSRAAQGIYGTTITNEADGFLRVQSTGPSSDGIAYGSLTNSAVVEVTAESTYNSAVGIRNTSIDNEADSALSVTAQCNYRNATTEDIGGAYGIYIQSMKLRNAGELNIGAESFACGTLGIYANASTISNEAGSSLTMSVRGHDSSIFYYRLTLSACGVLSGTLDNGGIVDISVDAASTGGAYGILETAFTNQAGATLTIRSSSHDSVDCEAWGICGGSLVNSGTVDITADAAGNVYGIEGSSVTNHAGGILSVRARSGSGDACGIGIGFTNRGWIETHAEAEGEAYGMRLSSAVAVNNAGAYLAASGSTAGVYIDYTGRLYNAGELRTDSIHLGARAAAYMLDGSTAGGLTEGTDVSISGVGSLHLGGVRGDDGAVTGLATGSRINIASGITLSGVALKLVDDVTLNMGGNLTASTVTYDGHRLTVDNGEASHRVTMGNSVAANWDGAVAVEHEAGALRLSSEGGNTMSKGTLVAEHITVESAAGTSMVLEDMSLTVSGSEMSLSNVEVRGDSHFTTTAAGALTLNVDGVTFVLDASNSLGAGLEAQPFTMLLSADPLTETAVEPSSFYIDSGMLAGVNVAGNMTLDLSHWAEDIKAGGYENITLTFAEDMDFGEATTVQATLNGANFAVADYTGDNMVQFNVANLPTDTVPEPATATLSLLALTALAARRRRK